MDALLNQAISKAAFEDAWKFLKIVVPSGTEYHISPDELKLLGTLIIAYIGKPKLMNILTLALEAAYRLGEQAGIDQLFQEVL